MLAKRKAEHKLTTSRLVRTVSDEELTSRAKLGRLGVEPDKLAVEISKREDKVKSLRFRIGSLKNERIRIGKELSKEKKKIEKLRRKLRKK